MTPARRERALVRPHVVTGGRSRPSHNTFDYVTLISVIRYQFGGLGPEQQRLMELCRQGSLSVAEVAAHLVLPVSVTKILLSDLVDGGYIIAHAALPRAKQPDLHLLKDVLDGLRARL